MSFTGDHDKIPVLFYATLLVLPVCISMTYGGLSWAGVSQFCTVYTSHWTSEEILRNVHDFGDFPKMNISINHISKKIKNHRWKTNVFFCIYRIRWDFWSSFAGAARHPAETPFVLSGTTKTILNNDDICCRISKLLFFCFVSRKLSEIAQAVE